VSARTWGFKSPLAHDDDEEVEPFPTDGLFGGRDGAHFDDGEPHDPYPHRHDAAVAT